MSSLLVGRYRLLEQLGEGRLAVVYRATDESLQRRVLVHILREDLATQETLRQRFLAESTASAQRSHPALLEVFDSGDIQGRPFIVTDHVAGKPLYGQGALAPEQALSYVRQVTSAVALCQSQGVPHPPISSRNLLLVADGAHGHIKLVENWQLSPTDVTLDLAHYRAPELTEGKPPRPATAVYALGVLLYELLTGERPVAGNDATEVARAHLTLKLSPVSRVRPTLYMPALDELVYRATARTLEQRFPNAARFVEALNDAWRDVNGETQRLAVVPKVAPPPASNPGRPDTVPAPQRRSSRPVPPQMSTSGTASHTIQRAVSRVNQRARSSVLVNISRWLFLLVLLLAVALGSYVGTSYLVDRLFAIRLPQISLPDVGLPSIDVDLPDWIGIGGGESGEVLVVTANGGLNMRDAPGLDTDVVAVIPNGAEVRKLEGPRVADGVSWVRVRAEQNGTTREGWMSLNYLEAQ